MIHFRCSAHSLPINQALRAALRSHALWLDAKKAQKYVSAHPDSLTRNGNHVPRNEARVYLCNLCPNLVGEKVAGGPWYSLVTDGFMDPPKSCRAFAFPMRFAQGTQWNLQNSKLNQSRIVLMSRGGCLYNSLNLALQCWQLHWRSNHTEATENSAHSCELCGLEEGTTSQPVHGVHGFRRFLKRHDFVKSPYKAWA